MSENIIVNCHIDDELDRQYGPYSTVEDAREQGEAFLNDYAHLMWDHDVHFTVWSVVDGYRRLVEC